MQTFSIYSVLFEFFQACSLTSRRKRALTDENGKEIVASVRVYDPNTEKTTYGKLSFYTGSGMSLK